MFIRYIKLAQKIATILFAQSFYGRRYMLQRVLKSSQRHVHPIDVYYNIRTSGFVPNFLNDARVSVAKIASHENNHYVGCQPSCLRKALQSLPDTSQFVFYDYGCGMGRALVTASEFAFLEIVGVELSKELCAIAVENAQKIANYFPDRARINVKQNDAIAFELQGGRLVIFMYHSFGRTTLTLIVNKLEKLVKTGCDIFVIFENPVNGDLLDQSKQFGRWCAEQVPCDFEEINHHSDANDGFVVWRSINTITADRSAYNNFDIAITKPTWRAEVVRIN